MGQDSINKKIAQKLRRARRILDIGCEDGDLATDLAKALKKLVVGLDVSDANFKKAEKAAKKKKVSPFVSCVRGDAQRLSFRKEEFDSVTLSYTLHHLENPLQALDEIRRIMKPKGKLVVVECMIKEVRDKTTCCFYTLEDLRKIIEESGFRNVRFEHLDEDNFLIEAVK
jgi:demethylmenaquinone methyltransferase/2-methoxy-6-polyprenyl-1,4-benzoquinol methylase